ncbi:MAG: lipid-A-disaccharide synthase [Proteobacteria bacterium]|nr:MAG: lipid-A-disaccharide synthase [Pseudomonadota bacterium]
MKIALVAGETSGDTLGAGLVREIRRLAPDAEFEGIAGPRMIEAGARSLYDMDAISIMGLDGLFANLKTILAIRDGLHRRFLDTRPDVFVGIDVPDFNLGLEYRLRRAGIPTIHYVSPTVWAWRRYRIRKIRKAVDHMLALFPFEADFYRKHGIPVTFVGHPLADTVSQMPRNEARRELGLSGDGRVVALLPGSRGSEIARLGKPFLAAAALLLERDETLRFVVPSANAGVRAGIESSLGKALPSDRVTLIDGRAQIALRAADAALLASGTAALEAALTGTPMVVAYRVSAVSYCLVKLFSTVDHYSMPNHLLDEPIVPEFIQRAATPENLAAAVWSFLADGVQRVAMRDALAGIRETLAVGADRRASKVVLEMAGGSL